MTLKQKILFLLVGITAACLPFVFSQIPSANSMKTSCDPVVAPQGSGLFGDLVDERSIERNDIPKNLPSNLKKLIDLTFSSNPFDRGKAAEQLGDMGKEASPAIPFLIHLFGDVKYFRERRFPDKWDLVTVDEMAAEALVKIGKMATQPCLNILKQSDNSRRRQYLCILVLGQLKDPKSVDLLLSFLTHKDPVLRANTIDAIRKHPGREAWNNPKFMLPLIAALNDRDDDVRKSAACALESHNDPLAVQSLISILDHDENKHAPERPYVARSLASKKDPRIVPILIKIINHEKEQDITRYYSALSLAEVGDAKTLDLLLDFVSDTRNHNFVRQGVLIGLSQSNNRRLVARVKTIARKTDEIAFIRKAAFAAIAKLDGSNSRSFLVEMANSASENVHVRWAAAMQVISMTNGAIDNPTILNTFENGIEIVDGDYYLPAKALRLVLKNGKTEAVRAKAKEELKRIDEPEVFPVFDKKRGIEIVELERPANAD